MQTEKKSMSAENITAHYQRIEKIFDDEFYAKQVPETKPNYVQYLKAGHMEGRPPNLLFSPVYYRCKYLEGNPNIEPLLHYLEEGDEKNYNPHPLFNTAYYKKQAGNIETGITALEHYLSIGWKNEYSPSPYFDVAFYNKQLTSKISEPHLCHYLAKGENQNLNPNNDFDVRKHTKASNPKSWHYLAYDHLSKLDVFVLNEQKLLDVLNLSPLQNLQETQENELLLKRLFDESFYFQCNPGIISKKIDPLRHYLKYGSSEGKFPHPLFSPDYYQEKHQDSINGIDPLLDYLKRGNEKVSPHPLFDIDYYLSQLPKDTKWEGTWLEHFLEIGYKKNISPSPFFNVDFYLEKYPFVKQKKANPILHYLRSGEALGYQPDFDFFPAKAWRPSKPDNIKKGAYRDASKLEIRARGIYEDVIGKLVNFKKEIQTLPLDNPKMVFISHDASRTGAPLIILKLAQQFKELYNITPIIIIGLGGELVAEFKELGPTYLFKDWSVKENPNTLNEMGRLMDVIAKLDVFGFLVNSAESRMFSTHIANLKKPSIFLIHEMGQAYAKDTFSLIGKQIDRLVFPSESVVKQAHLNSSIQEEKCLVIGQGLLKPNLLEENKNRNSYKQKLIQAFGLEKDAFIVLGCGSINKRKGVDLWVQTAISVCNQLKNKEKVYFMWVGEQHQLNKNKSLRYWIDMDIEQSGLKEHILFVGATKEPEKYFLGADALFLSSRLDPFPCVMHEAMASKLPVVCFDKGGGYVDMFNNGVGLMVNYLDVSKAATAILSLYRSPSLYSQLASNGLEKVTKYYMFKDYTCKIALVFNQIICYNALKQQSK